MSCKIIRNKENKIQRVNAPNGKESILYKSIKDLLPDKIELDSYVRHAVINGNIKATSKDEIALALWSKVYTSKFKEWFGDWENDPKNASKVVDQNGEPLIRHHGVIMGQAAFDNIKKEGFKFNIKKNWNSKNNPISPNTNSGVFFSDIKTAFGYGINIEREYDSSKEDFVFHAYLNIRELDSSQETVSSIAARYYEKNKNKSAIGMYGEEAGEGMHYNHVVFEPNQIKSVFNEGDFSLQSNNIYYQLSDEDVREIDPAVEKQMMELIEAVGGKVELVNEIKDVDGNPINAAAKLDALNGVIELVQGKRGVSTLAEETAHLITALLGKEHPLMKQMMSNIVNFPIYQEVLKEYKDTNYTAEDMKFEAVGKMIAKNIIKGEPLGNYDREIAKNWFQRLMTILGRMFYGKKTEHVKPLLDSFQKAAEMFMNKKILNEITPVKFNKEGVKKLASRYNMLNTGFIDSKGIILENLKSDAAKLELTIGVSDSGNYFFQRNGSMLNPFKNQEYYQLKPKTQSEIIKQLRDDNSKLSPNKVTITDERGMPKEVYGFKDDKNYPKGYIENRVSDLQSNRFNRNLTNEELIANNNNPNSKIPRETGTLLHDVGEQYLNIGVSKKDNLALPFGVKVPTKEPQGNSVADINIVRTVGKSINKMLDEIAAQQREIDETKDAIVIAENFVQDPNKILNGKKGIAGSQDVLVIYSDGSASIYDYKFINFTKKDGKVNVEQEIPFSKRQSYHLQIAEYKRILEEVYGIKHFRQTRIMPFDIKYQYNQNGIQNKVKSLTGFDVDSDKNYLIPLPVASEFTGNEKYDEILTKLFQQERKLSKKISKNFGSPNIVNPLLDEAELLKRSIKAIQVKTDVLPLIDSINKTLNNLAKAEESATIDDIENLYKMYAEIEMFESIYENIIELKDTSVEKQFDDVISRLGKARTKILLKVKEVLSEEYNNEIGVEQRELTFMSSQFSNMSDINHPLFTSAKKLINESFGETKRMMDALISELEKKKNALGNDSNLLSIYQDMINDKTGNLKGMFSQEFFETQKDKRQKKDSSWFQENYKYTEEGKKKYKEDLELYKKSLEGNPQEYINNKIEQWENNNNLEKDSAWLKSFTLNSYAELKNPEKFHSEFYKSLSGAKKEYYDFYRETNKFLNSLVSDKIDANFIANVSRDIIDTIAQKGNVLEVLKNSKTSFVNSLKVRQNDMISVEGEEGNDIPLLYKDTFSYYDKESGEWVNGLEKKNLDLTSNLVLFAESVFNKHNMSKIKGTIEGMRLLINNQKVIKTNAQGKPLLTEDKKLQYVDSSVNSKVFSSMIDALVYGRRIQNKDSLVQIGDSTFSTNKFLSSIMSYMSTKSLAFNYISGIGNLGGAYFNSYIKGKGGKYYTSEHMKKTHMMQIKRRKDDLYNHLTEYFNVANTHWTKDQAAKLSLSKLTKNLTYEKWYLLQEKGDVFVANTILVSMLQNYGLDENGKTKRLALLPEGTKSLIELVDTSNDKMEIKGLSPKEFDAFRAKVLYVSKQVKGTSSAEDISMIQTTVWGKSIMHFKSWIAPMVKERLGDLKYTPEVQEWEIGRYKAIGAEIFSQKFIPTILKIGLDIISFGKIKYKHDINLLNEQFKKWEKENPDMAGKLTKEEFIDLRERAIREAIHEAKIMSAMLLLMFAASRDYDDDGEEWYKDNAMTKQAYKILNRTYLELSFFVNPLSFRDIVKTPIPLMQVFTDAFSFGKNTIDETSDILFGENDPRDKTGKFHYGNKMIPGMRMFQFMEDIDWGDEK